MATATLTSTGKSTLPPKATRSDDRLRELDPGRYYGCLTKIVYFTWSVATRAAYYLSEFRGHSPVAELRQKVGIEYEPYQCKYCGEIHIGRINRVRRPVS